MEDIAMPEIKHRSDKLEPIERKFKPFKKALAFTDREDAFEFAQAIDQKWPELAREIVIAATR
jgi:hypothetical protein